MKPGKLLSVFLALALMLSCFSVDAFAASAGDLKNVNDKLGTAKEELKKGKEQQNELLRQIDELNGQIEGIEADIAGLDTNIAEKQQQIDEKKAQLDLTQSELDVQNDAFSERLRVMYKNGETGIVEVLIGSSDIVDLISNLHMFQLLYDYDMEVLESIQEKYDNIKAQKAELETLKSDLESTKIEKQNYETDLNESLSQLEEVEAKVASDNEALEAQIDELNRQADAITAELQAGSIKASTSANSKYSGGILLWPVPEYARISSRFGYRIHPILGYSKFHSGLDIAAASGKQILSANGGTVIFAGTKSGYGKTVMVDHGGGIVTLYGHCSSLLVSRGQSVTRGQVIALVGSTGQSTGPHCHFEVRLNGSPVNPQNYL